MSSVQLARDLITGTFLQIPTLEPVYQAVFRTGGGWVLGAGSSIRFCGYTWQYTGLPVVLGVCNREPCPVIHNVFRLSFSLHD